MYEYNTQYKGTWRDSPARVRTLRAMTSITPLDDRLRDIVVVLRNGDNVRVLNAAASVRVLERYREVRHEAARWRLKLGKQGRLLVVDDELCAEISAFVDTG
jgi:hypothetical protein